MEEPLLFREYRNDNAPALAEMWRQSREGWPPGFLGASVFSAESVDAEERSSGRLFTVLALQGERVVGFCRTTPWGGEPRAAYVALLSVVPDLHGKKIGRDLLLDAVSRSAGLGYRRIDLHTWPANLKAMPLYKKTGFFWVPDTQVYMQNYMPFLVQRPEVRDFLEGDEWYGCLDRELNPEPDEERTPSGREVFTYILRRNGRVLRAEFDRRGRILSGFQSPGVDITVDLDPGPVYFGRKVGVSISGRSLPPFGPVRTHDSLTAPETFKASDGVALLDVSCLPVEVPIPERDRMPTVSIIIPGETDMEVGLGLRAEEPVALVSPGIMWTPPGSEEVNLDVRKLCDAGQVLVSAELDGKPFHEGTHPLGSPVFQGLRLPLPAPPAGLHLLSVRFSTDDIPGAWNSIALACGDTHGETEWVMTRTSAVKVTGRLALVVHRRGAGALMFRPDRKGRSTRCAWFQVQAGPPFWNSDLPHQLYEFSVEGNTLKASSGWPSRPGLLHSCSFRLHRAGFAQAVSSVSNSTGESVGVSFSVDWNGPETLEEEKCLYPLDRGLFEERLVYNQVPDMEEDLPKSTGELGAPWLGLTGEEGSLMVSFPGWKELRYDRPGTGELTAGPGETVSTPPVRMLAVPGGTEDLLSSAVVLGWETGSVEPEGGFLDHNLLPVMARGSSLSLSHPLRGQRKGRISVDGTAIAEGMVKKDASISGDCLEKGFTDVSLALAGRDFVLPVLFTEGGREPSVSRENDDLLIANDRLAARLSPRGFGHVYSAVMDGEEYLHSEHPGPSVFEWESPWYGGIHPRICDRREAPFRLDWQDPSIESIESVSGGLAERGWKLGWTVDHKRFGSWRLIWSVRMLPGVPLLRTSFLLEPLAGCRCPYVEADLRGFLAPMGSTAETVMTCQSSGPLRQGREHAGAWAPAGQWTRVASPGGGFVEVYPSGDGTLWYEDYAGSGCHLSQLARADRSRELKVDWLFGITPSDLELSSVLRVHSEFGVHP